MTATKLVAAYLKRKGMTEAQLARDAELSRATLSNVLRGKRGAGWRVVSAIEKATSGEIPAAAWPAPKPRKIRRAA